MIVRRFHPPPHTFAGAVLLLAVLALLSVPRWALAQAAAPARTIAVTFDDLPYAGDTGCLADATAATQSMTDVLRAHRAPATAFVIGSRVMVRGEVDARMTLLRRWLDAGTTLENHSFSHRSPQRMPARDYRDDVVQGETIPAMLMAERALVPHFYRPPFNEVGATPADADTLAAFLAQRGYAIAPFTVENADYAFDRLFVKARLAGDSAMAARIGRSYVAQLDTALDFAEALAHDTFGRAIPQVLLIHASTLNASYLDAVLTRLEQRGYAFISLATAVRDPAYATPAAFTVHGLSWLHRWRATLGKPSRLRDEPDPPRWILDAYRAAKPPPRGC